MWGFAERHGSSLFPFNIAPLFRVSRELAIFPEGSGKFLLPDAKQVLPLAKVALEAYAFGDLKCRDQATFDRLTAFPSPFAS